MEQTCFVKFTNGFYKRSEKYQIATKVIRRDQALFVVKEGLTEQAKEHISRIYRKTMELNLPEPFQMPEVRLENGRAITPYVEGITINARLKEYTHNPGEFLQQLRLYVSLIRSVLAPITKDGSTEQFQEYFGFPISHSCEFCTVNNIDLIFDNIVIQGEKLFIIDNEWILDFPIPYGFILFRILCNAYVANMDRLNHIGLGIDSILDAFGILPFKDSYTHMDKIFRSKVFDYDTRTLDSLKHGFEHRTSSLFVDCGDGFREEQKLIKQPDSLQEDQDGGMTLTYLFPVPTSVRSLRWDPLEGQYCRCTNLQIVSGDRTLTASALNAVRFDGDDLFYSQDPQYLITGDLTDLSQISISVKISTCPASTVIDTLLSVHSHNGSLYEIERGLLNLTHTTHGPVTVDPSILYFDCGEGFSEEHRVVSAVKVEEHDGVHWTVHHFEIPESPLHIRWDPIEGVYCHSSGLIITAGNREFEAIPLNGLRGEEGDVVFYSRDPQYLIMGDLTGLSEITIRAEIRAFSSDGIIASLVNIYEKKHKQWQEQDYEKDCHIQKLNEDALTIGLENYTIKEMAGHLQAEIAVLTKVNDDLNGQLTRIRSSRTWKILNAINRFRKAIFR